jgi:hypothetical protein
VSHASLAGNRVAQVVIGPGRPEHLAPAAEALAHPVTAAERAAIERPLRLLQDPDRDVRPAQAVEGRAFGQSAPPSRKAVFVAPPPGTGLSVVEICSVVVLVMCWR